MISVVTPVFKEEKNITPFLERVTKVLSSITDDYEIIFCMDPSPDGTEAEILKNRLKNNRIKYLKFSRRFGQPMATLAGLHHSKGNAVLVMDVDLQDPPELILQMHEKWTQGYDVVYAQRVSRSGENFIYRTIAFFGYKFINRISEVEIPPNTGDFRLMSRRVVDEIKKLKESNGFLRGLVALVGFKQTAVPFERQPRLNGKGNYNQFVGSLKIGSNGIFCFSNYMLTICTKFGFAVAGISFLIGIVYAFMKLTGTEFPIGNPTIVILVLFLGGVQLISVGILGEYIARIYDEVRERPKYIVEHSEGFNV
jgi:glycosyltransferase involved in cell wall biosynthesis